MNTNKFAALLALFAILTMSFAIAIPAAHADAGGNQVRIDSVTLSPDGTTLIISVSATINDPTVTSVVFSLSVSYGYRHLNLNKQGTVLSVYSSEGTVQDLYAQATFLVPFQGPGYYLIVTNAFDSASGAWLGGAWVDPREGTAQ